MKAVIVEISGKHAVALDKSGSFVKIKNNGRLKIGYEIELPVNSIINMPGLLRIASIAASFLLVMGVSFGAYSYGRPYSYIDVDINPSIEITANMYDRIIKVEGLNDDGRKLLTEGSYKNKSVSDGVEGILNSAVNNGYLLPDLGNAVLLTVSSRDDKKAEKIEDEIQNTASGKLRAEKLNTEILVDSISLDKHDSSKEAGISPGKLSLIEKAVAGNAQLKVDDLKEAPVREIIKAINSGKENQAAVKEDKDKENVNSANSGKHEKDSDKPVEAVKGNNNNKNDNGNKSDSKDMYKSGKEEDKSSNSKGNTLKQDKKSTDKSSAAPAGGNAADKGKNEKSGQPDEGQDKGMDKDKDKTVKDESRGSDSSKGRENSGQKEKK